MSRDVNGRKTYCPFARVPRTVSLTSSLGAKPERKPVRATVGSRAAQWHTWVMASPRRSDVSFEAKRCRHVAVAVGEVSIGDLVAAGTGQQSPQSQQNEVAPGPSVEHRLGGQALDRSLGLRNIAVGAAFQQGFHQNAVPQSQYPNCPLLYNSSMLARRSGTASRSPRRIISSAKRASMTGTMQGVEPAVHRHFTNLPQ